MKKVALFIGLFLLHYIGISQVGINNTDPKASLDITASNPANPSNTDGILIPRIDAFPTPAPTAAQHGMMVYLTTASGGNPPGFYFWDNNAGPASWGSVVGVDDDWIVSGGNVLRNTGNVLVNRTDQNYKLSLGGFSSASQNSSIDAAPSNSGLDAMVITTDYDGADGLSVSQNSGYTLATRSAISTYNNRGNMTANLGYYSNVPTYRSAGLYVTNPGNSSNTHGVLYEVQQASNVGGDRSGLTVDLNIDGSGSNYYGVKSDVAGVRTSTKYGVYTKVTAPNSVGYGLYSDVQSVNDYAAYLIGRTSLGEGTTNRYLMPAADGTSGQVLATDGAGQISYVTPTIGAEKIDDLTDGKSDSDGSEDGSSIFLGINAGAADDSSNNSNIGIGLTALEDNISGTNNVAVGWGSLRDNIGNSNTAYGHLSAGGNTNGTGNTAIGRNALLNNTTGDFNTSLGFYAGYLNTGSGNLFLGANAGFNQLAENNKLYIENSDADADNALIYGDFGADNSTSGNILRTNSEFQIGNPTGTGYAFPTIDGTAGQVLATDGAGQVSYVTPNLGVEKIDDLTDGKSDSDGTNDGSSIFLGINAGAVDDVSDNKNVGIGFESLMSNTSGSTNIAIGYRPLVANTIGSSNVSIGYETLYSNTTGQNNIAVGLQTLHDNIDGYTNIAIGRQASEKNTSGRDNVAIGSHSLNTNTTGEFNTAIGENTLRYNTNGSRNSAFGQGTLSSNIGSNNTALGAWAGANSTGDNSVYLGTFAGRQNTISNTLWIENTNANEDNALIYGEFDTNILRTNSEFQIGNPTGTGYAFPTIDGAAGQVLATDGAGQLSFTTISSSSGTLDEAYDFGGAGAGKNITADTGAVRINGDDGFLVTGTFGSGNAIDTEITGAGTRMFFNPNKAAFRAGNVSGTQWDNVNVGSYSTAFGETNTASGVYSMVFGKWNIASGLNSTAFGEDSSATSYTSTAFGHGTTASGSVSTAFGSSSTASGVEATAFGQGTTASGLGSTAFGIGALASGQYSTASGSFTTAPSAFETVIGSRNTTYTPASTTTFNQNDRLFTIGNGVGSTTSNALIIYKNGSMNINDAYTMPTADGTANQVMTTNGSGSLSWNTLAIPSISGTSNYIPKFTGASSLGNSIIYNNGSSVGIGTNTPSEMLSVNGIANLNEGITSGIALKVNGVEALYYNGSASRFSWGYGGTANYFADKVGIGENNPTFKLEVKTAENANYVAHIKNTSTGTGADGLKISVGTASPTVNNYFAGFFGGTTLKGRISGNSTLTGVNYYTTSDERLKTKIKNVTEALDLIQKISPRKYEYKVTPGIKEYGFIAQELQPIYPQAVSGSPDSDVETDPMMVDYSRLTPLLTAGIKELNEKVTRLEIENEQLKTLLSKFEKIEARLNLLEEKRLQSNDLTTQK